MMLLAAFSHKEFVDFYGCCWLFVWYVELNALSNNHFLKEGLCLNFSEKFKPALHTVQYSFMGRTVTFVTGILLVGVLHSIVISFIFAGRFQ